MQNNIRWRVGDGHDVLFWIDSWVLGVGSLLGKQISTLGNQDLTMNVSDFVGEDGRWDINLMLQFLPSSMCASICSLTPPNFEQGRENILEKHE